MNKIRPLRKSKDRILSDSEIEERLATKRLAAKLLPKKKENRFERFNLKVKPKPLEILLAPYRFSLINMKSFGDYVCNVLNTKMVSDAKGWIADILLTVPPGKKVDELYGRHLRKLIELLYVENNDRHFTMLCDPNHHATIQQWFANLGIDSSKYTLCISTFNYSIWAQDAYVALKDELNNSIICEGVHFPRYDDVTIADDIAAQTNSSVLQSYLYFQGGNILETEKYVLIGKDYIYENLGRAFLDTEERVTNAFEKLFSKEILVVGRDKPIPFEDRQYLGGGIYQPIFHIDMYVTPTGKKDDKSGKEIILVGSPKLGRASIGDDSKPKDYNIYFDEVAEQLSTYFEVKRLPILPSFIKYEYDLVPPIKDERYYYLSYNNALVENFGENLNVYLPTFSQDVNSYIEDESIVHYEGKAIKRKKLDDAAAKVWEDQGFTVHRMDGLEDLAIGWGSVHCITKTLIRIEPESDIPNT